MPGGYEESIGHGFAGAGEDPVAETRRESDDSIRIIDKRLEAEVELGVEAFRDVRRRAAEAGESERYGRGGFDKPSAGHGHMCNSLWRHEL